MHTAIIMDGNGRWGTERGATRVDGHRAGADAVRRTVEAAPSLGIGALTLYAFSSDNWRRPRAEVDALMALFADFLQSEKMRCVEEGVRLEVIGRRDRLSASLRRKVEEVECATAHGAQLLLRLAIDYSSRDALVAAAEAAPATRAELEAELQRVLHARTPCGDVDLLIRTGREKRLSDFLLWESAYAEIVFTDVLWPDFTRDDLAAAVAEFHKRTRRFGGVEAVMKEELICTTF